MPKFYITGLYHTPELNDRTLPPIVVEADDRLDALTRTGCTVWTEEEWRQAQGRLKNAEGLFDGPHVE
jgi:hypothetical protein